MARLNGVHAFGYNSTGSERIWMKCGALSTLFAAGPGRFCLGAIGAEARARRFFCFFCEVSNARFHRLPVGQISRNVHTRRGSTSP